MEKGKNPYRDLSEREPVYSIQTVYRAPSEKESSEREEIESLLSREDLFLSTDVLCIRMPLVYKLVYKKYVAKNRARLELLKSIVGSSIVVLAKQDDSALSALLSQPGKQIILNMNVNHVEQKVEQRVDVNIDATALEEIIEELREITRLLEQTKVAYAPALRNYAKKLRRITTRINDVKRQLETN